jgi:hypothetical protein
MYKKYNTAQTIALNSFREKGIIGVLADYINNHSVRIREEADHRFLVSNKSDKNILINKDSANESDKKQSDYTFLYWNKYETKTKQSNGRDDYNYIHFLILGGKKGDFRVICNSYGEITSLQMPDEAGMNFFNVFVAIPCGPNSIEGMIILEHKGIYSAQSLFFKSFSKFYNDDEVTMKIYNISDCDVVERLIETKPIRELKLIKYFENPDRSELNYCEREKRIYIRPKFPNLRTALKGMFQTRKCIGTQIPRIDLFSDTIKTMVLDCSISHFFVTILNTF